MYFKRLVSFCIVSLLIITCLAQSKQAAYQKSWKKIDSLINKQGLTQSALAEVNKVYEMAKKQQDNTQLIKALLYKMNLQAQKEENAEVKNIQQLQKEITAAQEPVRSILQSIEAELYWQYFQQHRWQLYNRTETTNFNKEDLATWSRGGFHRTISELYLASLKNESLLQQTKLAPYDDIIIKGNVRYLRPTLFDLLAHRALEYFKNNERDIDKPAYAFEINEAAAFGDIKSFTTHAFITPDSTSLHVKALQLFQRLLKFHSNDARPDALIDVNIDRLQFVNTYAVMPEKETLYKKALEQITQQYGALPAASQAWYLLAQWYAGKAQSYDPLKDTTYRYAYLTAREIAQKAATQKDSSEGKTNALQLLQQIQRKELNLTAEKVQVPAQPFRILVAYRNLTQLYFRVIKIDKKTKAALGTNTWEDEYWQQLLKLPVVKIFSQTLPDTKDFQQHRVEVKAEGLPAGEYLLLASANNDFGLQKNPMTMADFYVSNIAFINHGQEYFVLHRETGQPLARATAQVWYTSYDYNLRRNTQTKGETLTTDNNGHFQLAALRNNKQNNYNIELTTAGDHLFLNDVIYNYAYNAVRAEEPQATRSTFLFTDRSIYRPGQLIYFKGIVVNARKEQPTTVAADFATTIVLYDVNGQKVDSIKVTTNEYGSYTGRFTLPANLLNGSFYLHDALTQGRVDFSVEEYKRPKFQVAIAPPAGTYRINDSIQVTGLAKAYSGNTIDGATVQYRVVRKTIMPMWYYGGYSKMIWPPRQQSDMEIAHGSTTTDAKGEFKVRFKAIPDNSINKKDQPVFYYEVSADVTDINGETRSGNLSVPVSYQALKLTIDVPEKLSVDSLKNIRITTSNLQGLFEQATVTFTMHALQAPAQLLRERYWPQPDQFVMTEAAYRQAFPYDVYKNEDDPASWPKQQQVVQQTATTTATSNFAMPAARYAAGWYVLEATTKDKYGETVKEVRYVQLYNNNSSGGPLINGVITLQTPEPEPGKQALYQLSTNADSAFVIHDVTDKNGQEKRSFVWLNNNSQLFELPLTEKDRGGIGINMAFVKHNRIYTDQQTIAVPYTNKELTIAYETFRDKTLPGSQETWKVKISGFKGDQVAAELLTAMYDASLDQFKPHSWQTPYLWPVYSAQTNWQGDLCFTQVQSQERAVVDGEVQVYVKIYDQLIANLYAYQETYRNVRTMAGLVAPPAVVGYGTFKKEANQVGRVTADMAAAAAVTDSAASNNGKAATPAPVAAVETRKNFNETAFFFPDLKTDNNGTISFSFTLPEALTQWKWMSLAHTKELAFGYSEKNIITQKTLMVQPNAPRFLREGDRMDFSAKIVNMGNKEITGQVVLELIDPANNQSVDGWFRNMFPNQFFTVPPGQSVPVSFTIEIPYQYNRPVTYRIIARTTTSGKDTTGGINDGEEAILPLVSNRMLVTESLPLPVRGTSQTFTFDKLLQSGKSETLSQHALTIEFTSNPAWYAVQSLPYLMDYPYECSEQHFNRYYANALAAKIANASPRIKAIFESWKNSDTAALLSNLQKNEELKAVLLQETPWVLEAKTEAQQKKNIALLFDMVRMNKELAASLDKLVALQSSNGGFVWFKGGPDDRYITQYILSGIGHLKKLGALPTDARLTALIKKALPYLDKRLQEDYNNLVKSKANLASDNISYIQIQYLYMRSFFPEYGVPGDVFTAYNYYRKQSQQFWLKESRYMQGMIALSLFRTGDVQTAKNIVASLKQNAIVNEEMGMYWKEVTSGYFWYQAPVETQSLLIEAFTEVTNDTKAVNDLKTWLLKQKQTQNWRTTRATADACYALLLQGTDWLGNTPAVQIKLGDYTIRSGQEKQEAGTGYFKKVIEGTAVKPSMGQITVSVDGAASGNPGVSWGAVYWQYFEDLDKITPAATPLQLSKKLFVEKKTDRGSVLQPVNAGDALQIGDKIKVRIELRADRALEYVHMKDMRASCMEPVNVLSEYKWQGGLGYYESTKDASTNFFFNWLPKGTYVFEYALFVTHSGTFSNGVTSVQCMYAPEFTSHSEGIKVNVETR